MIFTFTKDADGIVNAVLGGRLDTTNAEDFGRRIQPLMDGAKNDVVMDCADLEYISSSGLRMMLTLLKNVKQTGGSLKLLNMRATIREVFDMTGFSKLFDIQ